MIAKAIEAIRDVMRDLTDVEQQTVAFWVARRYGVTFNLGLNPVDNPVNTLLHAVDLNSVSVDLNGVNPLLGGIKGGKKFVRKDPVIEAKVLEVLEFLNTKAGRNFRQVEENMRYIRARLKNSSVEDIKGVIVRKTREWKNTEYEKFLRPQTLFKADKFEAYIGEQGT